jgi:hypothetical protein
MVASIMVETHSWISILTKDNMFWSVVINNKSSKTKKQK